MEKLLNEPIIGQLREMFGQLKEPVQILFFGAEDERDYCADTRQLLESVGVESLG